MTLYIIRGDTVAALASPPAEVSKDELLVQSVEDLAASNLTKVQLTVTGNKLPDAPPVTRFQDRASAVRRLWAGLSRLPVDPEPVNSLSSPRLGSKQSKVIELLKRPEETTVAEVIDATGWQPHTVRGLFSGALKKKHGLTVISAKEDRGRVYRGEIVHKDRHYPAEHSPIIDPELWEAAQAKLAANAVEHSSGARSRNP